MGWFDWLRKPFANPIERDANRLNDVVTKWKNDLIPMFSGGGRTWDFSGGWAGYRRALLECSPLSAIMLQCAEAFSNGCFEVLNANNDNYVRGRYKDWEKLIDKPNRFTSKTEFLQRVYIEMRTYGYCYVLPIYSAGFEDRPSSLYILPNEFTEIEVLTQRAIWDYDIDKPIRKVWFTFNGKTTEIEESKLVLFKDNTVTINPYTLLPDSVLNSLKYPLSLFVSSEEAAVTLVQNRGALGVLSSASKDAVGSIPLANDVKIDLQRDFQRYGLSREQWQVIIASQSVDWVQIGMDVAALRLDENRLQAVREMCFLLGYPIELTPWSTQSTYNNKREAAKDFYQNKIIPQAHSFTEQLNAGLKTANDNVKIQVTYEDVYVFKQSQEEEGKGMRAKADAIVLMYKNNLITYNRSLEMLGEDIIVGGDYYYYQSPEYSQNTNYAQENQRATEEGATD